MTDEELGRAWSRQQGYVPVRWEFPDIQLVAYYWSAPPPVLSSVLRSYATPWYGWKTEADAYAALGRAVREVHRQVPPLREGE